jgi:adenine-specific DNA-methyltransferase
MTKSKYSHLSKDQLLALIYRLEDQVKHGLIWDDEKEEEQVVINCNTKSPLLKEVKSRNITTSKKDNHHMLIEGDNYHALTVLTATHKEKIDLIYIDPPYNTGKSNDFMYNDKYVDINDGYRHSKWLSFMNKRLLLAHELMSDTAAIFISIDDNEIAQLKLLCNKIFGESNFVAQIVRKNKAGSGHDSGQIAVEYDYMLCFAKNKSALKFEKEVLDVENDTKYKLIDDHVDFRGKYYLRDLDYKGSYSELSDYPITTPDGDVIYPGGKFGKHNTWRWGKEKFHWGIDNDFIVFKKNKDKWKVYIKQYQFVDNENKQRVRKLPYRALVHFLNSEGSTELREILDQNVFKFPKSTALILYCIHLMPSKDITVLDFFAGSGTTGHAVLKANAEDGGNRQFIICTNNENGICDDVTYPRIQKVMQGYTNKKGQDIKGLGGNLTYYKTSFK